MKVLIVDDEIHLINAIKLLVPWEHFNIQQILTATSVPEAIQLLEKEKPELAFFDMVIDSELGTKLMQFVITEHLNTKVIAISGHSDFKYVRDMLVLGCVDYLLKPIDRQLLTSAVEKAIQSWKDDYQKTENNQTLLQQINYLSSEHKHTLLGQLLSPTTAYSAYEELRTLSKSFAETKHCLILYSNLSFYPQHDDQFQKAFTIFFDILKTDLENRKLGTTILQHWSPCDAIIFLYGSQDLAWHLIKTALTQFRRSCQIPFHFGSSLGNNAPADILSAYEQAKRSFYQVLVNLQNSTPLIAHGARSLEEDTTIFEASESHILSGILINDEILIKNNIGKWIEQVLPINTLTYHSIYQLSQRFIKLYHHWCQYFKERYPDLDCIKDSYLTPYYLFDSTFIFQKTLAEQYFTDILISLSSQIYHASQSHDLIEQIADYMEINYKQPFDQSEYAHIFNINKDYMCRKFTEVYGISMVSRLNQIRIEQAKKLLRSSNIKISQIAQQIGYNDDKYFIKTFKKHTGLTPNEYRKGTS